MGQRLSKTAIAQELEGNLSDRVGIFMACLCCIHCLALPMFYLIVPHLGLLRVSPEFIIDINHFINGHLSHAHVGELHLSFHFFMFFLVAPVALYSLTSKIKVHQDKRPLYVGIVSIAMLLSSIILVDFMHFSKLTETSLTITGSILLLFAHILNIKACQCKHCHHS